MLKLYKLTTTIALLFVLFLQGQVNISEIYFDTYFNEFSESEHHHHGEFIELYNRSTQSVDLSNWMLLDYSGRGSFTIPQGTTIAAKDFIIIAYGTTSGSYSNDFPILFPSALGKESKIIYQKSIILKNGREGITLLDNQGSYKDEIRYTLDQTCRESIGNSFCYKSTISNSGGDIITTAIDTRYTKSLQRKSFDDKTLIVEQQATPFNLIFTDSDSGNGGNPPSNGGATFSNENYIYTRTYLEPTLVTDDSKKKIEEITYFDGLGRPKQNIGIKATPLGNDLVTPIGYDEFGRQTKNYLSLPQSSSGNGMINNSPETTYYTNNYPSAKLYSEKKLELSPLDRLQEQGFPGTDWNIGSAHSQKFEYDLNDEIIDKVKSYKVTTAWQNNSYNKISTIYVHNLGSNVLYKNKITDEDGNVTIEFKNGLGQTILIRKNDGIEDADTYYVYNEYSQLVMVIPPLASKVFKSYIGVTLATSDPIIQNLCYLYNYDVNDRLVEKKLPGKGWEYMVYDKQERLVASQDANMRENNQWLFTKYDLYGRVAYTGISTGGTRTVEQTNADSALANFVERKPVVGFTQNGLGVYYGNPTGLTTYPTVISTLLSVNYYDTYPVGTPSMAYQLISQNDLLTDNFTVAKNTKGLATASLVKNIENDNWTKNYSWYDQKGRAVSAYSQNHIGGNTRTETELDFSGIPQKTYTYHKRLSTDTEIVIKERYEYDNQKRLLKQYHQVNTNAEELLTNNEYNELGQLKNKKVGGVATATTPLQIVDYKYNIRGWMTQINDLANLGTDLFGYNVNYNTLDNRFSGTAKYNGNIAQITWKTNYANSDKKLRNYSYSYDKLNRLLSADYDAYDDVTTSSTSEKSFYNESLTYDINGNIITLKRFSNPASGNTPQKIDDLIYNYENNNYSNRLSKITLPVGELNNSFGYDALQNEFSYDANGNMSKHLDRKISSILYNYLNLPYQITQTLGNTNFVYRADGLKVKKTFAGKVTDYLDGFQYETVGATTVLQFLPTNEGYYDFVNNRYVYNYADHLGNVRLSYYKNASSGELNVIEESNYYPFGLKHSGYNTLVGNSAYKIGYNGKELQSEIQMYDYGARFYMPDIGRWTTIDPLAEFQRKINPYAYCYNNPVNFYDPTGMIGEGTDPDPNKVYNAKKDIETVYLVGKAKKNSGWNTFLNVAEWIPIAGNFVTIGRGLYEGDYKQVAIGVVFLAVDVATAGEGSTIIKLGEKAAQEAIEVSAKDALKVAAQDEAKDLAESALEEVAEQTVVHGNSAKSLKSSGNYELKFESGKTYNGVGNEKRMEKSIKRIEKEYGDKLVEKTFKPASNKKLAYIREHIGIRNNGGASKLMEKNYNRINSPGKKIYESIKNAK